MTEIAVYATLFLLAFGAATVLPLQSELAVVTLLLTDHPAALVICVASLGNVLGSVVNWLLGRGIDRLRDRSWFPVDQPSLSRAQAWYQRYGKWSLLLSWMPFIGDPLTLIAGILREPLRVFLPLVTIAKVGRYLVLSAFTLGIFST